MSNRREFLKKGMLAAPALLMGPGLGARPEPIMPGQIRAGGEEYWQVLRQQFPLDKHITFLNNGTIGPSPKIVIDAVYQSMNDVNNQANYGGWFSGIKDLAAYFNAGQDEICFTHNVTEGINIVAQGLPLKRGEEVIVSNHEHVGNALPWLGRAQRDKLVIRVLDFNLPDDALINALDKMINTSTRVIALPHVPCTTGRVMPIDRIAEVARKHKLWFFLDGAHGAGMLDLDFSKIDCDFYATCTHKWVLGPKGTGFIYIRKDKLDDLTPIFTGAHSDKGWSLIDNPPHISGWGDEAKRYLNGTQNRALFDGVSAAIRFHEEIGKTRVANRVHELAQYLFDSLSRIKGIQLLTPEDAHAGMISFRFEAHDYMLFYQECQEKHIIVRAVPENEVNAIRVSTHIYNSKAEIDFFVDTLKSYLNA